MPHVNVGVLNPPAATPLPFPIFAQPIQQINGVIAIGDVLTNVVITQVADITRCLVILNASSCWTAPPYSLTATLVIGDITGVLTPTSDVKQSEGAIWDWIDDTTIIVSRGGGEACECTENCVAFTLQVIEFASGVFV